MCITTHFIDCEWNLHKRIINLCLIPNHKGETIGGKIELCMLEWGIGSIFTITVDNASYNDTALEYLKKRTAHKAGALLENQFMHVRCCEHILNLTVSEGLKEVDKTIVKVRSTVKYVKSSPARFESFKTCMEREKLNYKGFLCLYVPTRWNSTFKMLEGVEKCQLHLNFWKSMMDTMFLRCGMKRMRKRVWDLLLMMIGLAIKIFLEFLRLFYEATM
jgi:hypothetical protein